MIKIFKTNGALQIAVILAATVVVWVPAFVWPAGMPTDDVCGPLYRLLSETVGTVPLLAAGVALLLAVLEGYLLNRLLYKKGLVPLNSLMPMLLYILIMGVGVEAAGFTPALLANLWIVLMLNSLMPKDDMLMEQNSIFNSTMWFSMAVISWMPCVYAAVPLIVGLLTYKVYRGREWSVALLGFLAPLIIVATALFLIDRSWMLADYAASFAGGLHIEADTGAPAIVQTTLFVLMSLIVIAGAVGQFNRNTIAQRKHGFVVMSMLVYAVATPFYGRLMPLDAQPFAISLAATGSVYLLERKSRLWAYDVALAFLLLLSLHSYIR